MSATDFDPERTHDDDSFSTTVVFQGDRVKGIYGYFKPGQFIPVHAPASDLVLSVQSGTGTVREGDVDRSVEPGDIVVVESETARGVMASDESCLEVLLVTASPPTDAEHELVREGLQRGQFDLRSEDA